ncbi:hypothetical protein [Microbacterium sp. zg.Y909]|uniref:hypothetical protein n=1 Tax=Microbacterium sp. zg.Y909 TaxID=2969413 RepID=UPI00214A9B48|nr:hypothetical protein [Microbacterium sp. zg.Y909]MCR2827265.1 hypothetical protein [Microbacterium sp. zg.Y909]
MSDPIAEELRAADRTARRLPPRRWLSAATFVGVIALIPASLVSLTAPDQSDLLQIVGFLALWFVCGGLIGGAAILIQEAGGWSRVTVPLVSVGIASVVCGVPTLILSFFDRGGYLSYSLLVSAPFVLAATFCVTLIAAFIPQHHRRSAVTMALLTAGILAILNVLR